MRAPTRAQVKVLKSLQNQSVTVSGMLATATEHQQRTGQPPSRAWYADYHDHAVAREALTEAALAGGVPRAWIDHVRERGARGISWRADLYLRAPEPVDWDRVLGGLDNDVLRLREWTALDAAHPQPGHTHPTGLDHNLHALHTRITGVANLLGLTTEQGQQLWGSDQEWVQASVAMLDGVPAEAVAQRWQQAARTVTSGYTLQARTLAEAGIPTDTAAALPQLDDLTPRIAATVKPPQPLFRSALSVDEEIEAAVDAANLTYDPDLDVENAAAIPIFSDPEGADPWTEVTVMSSADGLER
ncbi:hypothetical protein [Nocardia lijiangensis]|uniref:hypothetical protein n=1 Tax=Nocardia lijiangensis TaxID=299618 RepID=UPI0008307952|nr:hypothetical protein [Nocardia lijiangensis]